MKLKKKKKNVASPKRTTLKRPHRLQSAKSWISTYAGKNIVRGYAKHFRVDLVCSITELRLLGIAVSEQYEQAVKQILENRAAQKRLKQEENEMDSEGLFGGSDADFAFIIGYTSGGAPYGARWEDMP